MKLKTMLGAEDLVNFSHAQNKDEFFWNDLSTLFTPTYIMIHTLFDFHNTTSI